METILVAVLDIRTMRMTVVIVKTNKEVLDIIPQSNEIRTIGGERHGANFITPGKDAKGKIAHTSILSHK